jgi:hypothetical protein
MAEFRKVKVEKHRLFGRSKDQEFVDESAERSLCEKSGKIFVGGYSNLKGKWVNGYCKTSNKIYHITKMENLPSIFDKGLVPHYDSAISSVEKKCGEVVNVFLQEKDTDFMKDYFWHVSLRGAGNDVSNLVILELDVPPEDLKILHKYKADFVWGVVEKTIPPDKIHIKDALYESGKRKIPALQGRYESEVLS